MSLSPFSSFPFPPFPPMISMLVPAKAAKGVMMGQSMLIETWNTSSSATVSAHWPFGKRHTCMTAIEKSNTRRKFAKNLSQCDMMARTVPAPTNITHDFSLFSASFILDIRIWRLVVT